MPITINVPDQLRRQVEASSNGRNTVLYTAAGQPCFMYVLRHSDMAAVNSDLGISRHPAFIVGGVNKDELMIGQYLGSSRNSELISVPGVDPTTEITNDAAISLARNNGAGWHLTTSVEFAALALWCHKNGLMPRGNNDYGRDHATTVEAGRRQDGVTPGTASGTARTLTGSGPTSWRHDNTPFGISDLNGNVWEWTPGVRVVAGEIQIIENNDAALTATDLGAASASWMAIDGATGDLVSPGHANSVKYASANSGTADYTLYRLTVNTFEGMQNSTGANPVSTAALNRLKALALFPIAGSGLGGDGFYLNTSGERVSLRGGYWSSGSIAGVFALTLSAERSPSHTTVGARPAFVI
ncbi:SUMF1/EgtB/PvdO family nonheme iron enzyme [Pseudohongiella spirulinae]|uniref:Sulfatase-modifying factor enzyme-like domain-containing protein n=1 Tax=Pseudohongiella spirulinae TaxID=1249552 RepID=A0A0S2KEH2_9GAMM|nr:SUMF1/EgtB/PvdO family nonheme iron enzyme [Pseudohongiella spirulinae]ALO46565.1 hypothetical protein PS2015_1918 [Pseudohongiella spirulinae]